MKQASILTKSLLQTLLFGIKSAKWIKFKLATVALLLFDFLFYDKNFFILGSRLNLLIFSIFIVITSYFIHKKTINDKIYIWSGFAVILSAINIVYLRDVWSCSIYFVSLMSLIGSMYSNRAHNILFTFVQAIILQVTNPFTSLFKILSFRLDSLGLPSTKKIAQYIIIPLFLVSIFSFLYSLTNQSVANFFAFFSFENQAIYSFIDGPRFILWTVFFLLFGVFFVSAMDYSLLKFGKYTKTLIREETKKSPLKHHILGLTQELNIAKISFLSINTLLAIVLLTDIITFFSSSLNFSASELSKMVHSGTYIVTFTIALSSSVVLFFFRKNINFHPQNKQLITIAKIWIILNSIYVGMVTIKNAMYIFDYGLTPKRMSVAIFLASCLALLYFSYQKIDNKWTISYFLNRFMASACLVILLYSFIDHKAAIVKFSAYVQTENIDTNYLSQLCSHRQLLLFSHKEQLEKKTGKEVLLWRKFYPTYRNNNWKSYNYVSAKERKFYESDLYKTQNFIHPSRSSG